MHLALGCVLALVFIVVELVANPDDYFWPFMSIVGAVDLLVTIVVCLRPPGVQLRPDEMVVRRFGRSLPVHRKHLRSRYWCTCRESWEGESHSDARWLRFVVAMEGVEREVPAMWREYFLGRLSAREAEAADSKIKAVGKRDHS
jgi:hypothetical protein